MPLFCITYRGIHVLAWQHQDNYTGSVKARRNTALDVQHTEKNHFHNAIQNDDSNVGNPVSTFIADTPHYSSAVTPHYSTVSKVTCIAFCICIFERPI